MSNDEWIGREFDYYVIDEVIIASINKNVEL